MRFTVYDSDDTDRVNGKTFDVIDEDEAAEQYAERMYCGADHVDVFELLVIGEDGSEWECTVDVDFEVTFSSSSTKREASRHVEP